MKIVIAGAGAVGTHLARMLSNENLDIVLIDPDEDKLTKLNSDLDIMALVASPTSIDALKRAGIESANLFIAVTPHESENLTCCMLAKQLGAKRTVARIDNYEYMQSSHRYLFENMGISSLIYPEMLAGKEIAASAQYSWVRQYIDFDGDLVLISVKMHELNPFDRTGKPKNENLLLGHTLKEISMDGHKFHVVAIKRDGDTIIPSGDERILDDDLVFFMTTKTEITNIRHLAGKDNYPQVKHVMIIGGGKLAVRTDSEIPDNMSLKIIERDAARCEELGRMVKSRTMIINGDGYDLDLLRDEGYNHIEAFAALTNNDEKNILACVAARRNGICNTYAQVENLAYLDMAESLDVGTVINKKMLAASHIYQMLLKADVNNVKMLTVADADVAEFVVKDGSRATKKPIMEIGLPSEVNIGGMIRHGRGELVSGSTQLQGGDRVVVFCTSQTLKRLARYFN